MRTPEQKVAFHATRLSIADAALARATNAFNAATKKSEDAIAYAAGALAVAEKRVQKDVEVLQKAFADAKHKLSVALAAGENSPGIAYARAAVVSAAKKHEALIAATLAALDAAKRKHTAINSEYQEAWGEVDAERFNEQQETAENLQRMKQERPLLVSPGVAADIEPPEGWAEFDRKANAEIQRKITEAARTNPQTDEKI